MPKVIGFIIFCITTGRPNAAFFYYQKQEKENVVMTPTY